MSKAGRPSGVTTGMSKREIIKEISDITTLKPDIVKNILDCFSDIMVRECIEKRSFHLANCFTVESKPRAARRAFNVHKDCYENFPATNVLTIRLSSRINSMSRWSQRHENNAKAGVSVSNYRDAID